MRSALLLPALLAACASAHAQTSIAQPRRIATPALHMAPATYPPGAEPREQRLLSQLSPSARGWVTHAARRLGPDISAEAARAAVKARFPTLSADADINTVMFLLMMACNRDSQRDLREQVAEMQAVNRSKQAQRETATRTKAESKADMDAMEQARLQAYSERRQKAFETISNLMKKSSDTASAIVSNLK